MIFLLSIRLKQVYRALAAAGWGILVVLLVVTAGMWIPMLAKLALVKAPAAALSGWILGAAIQLSRGDGSFLKQTALPAWKICLTDTALALLPGAILFLVFGVWPSALAFGGGGLAALVLPAGSIRKWQPQMPRFTVPLLPADLFEAHSAIRRLPLGWILAGALQLGAWYHIAFFLSAIALGLALLGMVFEFAEPKELLPDGLRPLMRKWRQYALVFHLFFAPAYLLAFVGHGHFMWLILYAALALETLLALLYFHKYSVWQPGRLRVAGSTFAAIGLLLTLLPGGLLVVLPLAVWMAVKARRRMEYWWR